MDQKIIEQIKNGGVGILPTDTLYGIVGSALKKDAVERIYILRKRNPDKPFIILMSSLDNLQKFDISLDEKIKIFLKQIWPNPISVILPCTDNNFSYLHRGTNTLAFRIPNHEILLELIKEVGPLAAPSANPEGYPPAKTLAEAKQYFGDKVDFYIDGGSLSSLPSTIVRLIDHHIEVIRQGSYQLSVTKL